MGHDIAFPVETGKIAANSDTPDARITLTEIERGLSAPLNPAHLHEILAPFSDKLDTGARDTLAMAGLQTTDVSKVIYVGGSSLMSMVPDTMKAVFPAAEHSFSNVFTAVTDGLAIAAARG